MTRRFTTRTAGIFAALLLASCFGDSTGPGERRPGQVNIAPDFNVRGIHAVDVNRVLIRFTKPNSTATVYDTIVPFPSVTDTLDLQIHIPINGASEQLLMTILMIDDPAADTVFKAGPTLITATAGGTPPAPTPVTFTYVGVGSKAAGVRFLATPTQVLFGDTVVFTAEAFDSNNVTIPNTPIIWTSSDTTRARIPADSIGRVIGGIARGPVTITAALLTPPTATRPLLIQPKPSAVVVQGGSGQTGGVGSILAQPVSVRVNAADNLGVAGVIVNFAVVTGGGTLSQLVDTTDANGDASVIWTLGATLGAQSVSATVPGVPGSVSVPATGVVGTAKKLAFQVQPTNVAANAAIAPAVTVMAQDTFGNTVANYTGNITIAIGTNPGAATLGGTTTVAAVAGVATFANLTLNALGTGYTLTAAATGLTGATSTTFNVAGGVPATLVVVQQPANTTGSVAITPAITIEIRDALNNLVPTATNTVTVAIGTNPSGGVLSGTQSVAAVGGVATFNTLSIDKSGVGYTLAFASTGLTGATSATFDITAGAASVLTFTTQPPSSAIFQSPFVTVVTARDAGGNVATSYTGAVTIGIGANPAGGTLFGTTTVNAVAGVATFSGISIDNIGSPYTLTANATGLAGTASGGVVIFAPASANAWINAAGGNWSTATNWSKGTVPTATDTVFIRQSGTYTVNLDVSSAALARLDVGAPLGTQTLSISANTLTMAGNGAFTPNGVLSLSGSGTLTGAGTLDLFGAFNWSGGSLNGGGGTARVNAGGTLTVSGPGAGRLLNAYNLEVAGNGTWGVTGGSNIGSGLGATLKVLSGGQLDLTTDAGMTFNQGGTATRLQVLAGGTLRRTTSGGAIQFNLPVDNDGSVQALSGFIRLDQGGNSSGAFSAAVGGTLVFGAGTHNLSAATTVTGAGTILLDGNAVNAGGPWTITGAVQLAGGILNYNAASGSTATLALNTGALGGSAGGLLTVTGVMNWSGGNLQGAGGAVRIQSGATLAITGTGTRTFTNYLLELASGATGTWVGTHNINSGLGAILRVQSGATLAIQGDPTFLSNQGGTATRFEVLGTLTRSTSLNPAIMQVEFDNDGQTTVTSGELRLVNGSGAGTEDGTFTVGAGSTLDFFGGTHSLGALSTITGAGQLQVDAGIVNIGGALAFTGVTTLAGGSFNYNGAAAGSLATLNVGGGTLGGSAGAQLNVTGAMTWSSGNIQGAGGKVTVLPAATLAISGATTRTFTNYVLELAGAGTWIGTQQTNAGLGSILRVLSGATLDVQGNPTFASNQGGANARLEVLGTFTRTTSAGVALMNVEFDNDAQTTVSSGTLRLSLGSGAGSADGAYTVAAGATLDFAGGTHTLGVLGSVGGAGTVTASAGTVNAAGNWAHSGTTQVNGGALNYSAAGGSTTNLNLTSGTLGGAAGGLLSITNAMTWSGGNLTGSGGTARVQLGGTLTISGAAARTFTNYVLELAGNGTWTGTHQINSGLAAILRVLAGATLDIQGDPTFASNQGGTAARLEVLGTLTRTVSAGVALMNVEFDNDAQTTVNTGTLRLSGGSGAGTADGVYTANAGTLLDFGGGTHSLGAAGTIGGAGSVQIAGGTVNDAGALAVTGAVTVNGGTFNYNGVPGGTTANLTVSSGVLGGSGLLTATATMNWTGGNLQGAGGAVRVQNPGTLTMSPAATFTTYTLELGGTGTWSGAAQINTGLGAVLRVLPTGNLNITGTPVFAQNQGGTTTVLDNQGTVQKTVAAGTSTMSVFFNSPASLSVATGTLNLTGGGNFSGPVAIASGAFLDYAGGTFSLNNGLNATGTGSVRFQGGTIVNASVADTARFQNLVLNGGTLNHIGGVVVSGTGALVDWAGGANLDGSGTFRVANTATMTVTGTASRRVVNGVLLNQGTTTWSGANGVNTGLGAVWRNAAGATFILSGDGNFTLNQGGAAAFDNLGSFTRNTSVGTAPWSAAFNHSGAATLTVSTGVLQLNGGGTMSAAVTVTSPGFLDLGNGAFTLNNGLNATGTGSVRIQGGTIANASVADTARFQNLVLNGGTLNHIGGVVVSGAGALVDWAGGASLDGSGTFRVANTATMTVTGTATRRVVNGVLLNQGTTTWSGANAVNTGLGAVWRNAAGATFTLSGDGNFTLNQGGAATFDNLGSFTRNTSAGTAPWSAAFNHSGAATLTVSAGVLQLNGGGTMSAPVTVTSPGFLDLSTGAFTLNNGLNATGTGSVRIQGGTIANASVADTARFQNLVLNGGTLNHIGGVVVSGAGALVDWAGGASLDGSGTFRVANTATMNVTGTATRRLVNGVLLNQGTTAWSGNLTVNTGLNGLWRNAAGANFNVTAANPTITLNQGGTATLNNLGAITRSVGAAGWVVNVPVSGTGTWNITAGNIDLQGGGTIAGATAVSAGATLLFNANSYTYTSPVTGAGTFQMNAGTVNYNTTMNIGTLTIAGGSFIMGGQTVAVTGNFSTSGGGSLSMTNATDSLDVGGNASFGGVTGPLSNGVIRLAGNFSQSGASNSFTATGNHSVRLNGAANQSINFASGTSFFRRLVINKAAGAGQQVALTSNVTVQDSLFVILGSEILSTGNTRLTLNGGFKWTGGASSPSIHPFVLEVTPTRFNVDSTFVGAARIFPDTVVWIGASLGAFPLVPTSNYIQWKSMRVAMGVSADSVVWQSSGANDTLQGDLVMSSGRFVLRNSTIVQKLKTQSTGALRMVTAGQALTVRDSAVFAGASTTGLMTAGILNVRGDFVQLNTGSTTSFDPSTAHVTVLNGSPAGTGPNSTVSFAGPTTSAFDSLVVNKSTGTRFTVNFVTDARVKRGMTIQNSSDVTGPTARITIGNSIQIPQVTTSGTLQNVRVVEMSVAPTIGPGAPLFSPDTTVFNGAIATLPVQAQIVYKSIRVNTTGAITMPADTIANDVDVATGTASFPGTFFINGKLRTRGAGAFAMPVGGAPFVTVVDSAIFAGGSTTGLLVNGIMVLRGPFV